MAASRTAPPSLYHRLLSSHLQIAGIAGLLLCACLMMIVYFQHGSAKIADVRLPSSIASARVLTGIEATNNLLRSWVLLGNRVSVSDRQRTWGARIEPAMNELETLAVSSDLESIVELRRKMGMLEDSQWWVEDVAATVGNNPARLIYERDLLPIFDRIQRAVIGLNGGPTDEKQVGEIRLAVAETHQNLSEAIRQLSEAVRTGSVAEIKDFDDGSLQVEKMLTQLSERIAIADDARPLLDWIFREYQVYKNLARQTIEIRQSDDWNRALFVLRAETEPLANDVRSELNALQAKHNGMLQQDVSRSALISRVGSVLTLFMIVGLGIIAWAFARIKSDQLVAPIEALTNASDRLANSHDYPVQLPVNGPREIARLIEKFNYMSRELTARTNDLQHANRELQVYTQVITHDLKPPLINISGHAELIKDLLDGLQAVAADEGISEQELRAAVSRALATDIPDSVSFIDLSIAKTNKLISGILDNSRLLFRDTKFVNVDMGRLVDQVAAVFSHRLVGVHFYRDQLPTISTDAFLMEHVFSNLIDNALKYLDPNRPGQIHIAGTVMDEEARFSVTDNGIGLDNVSVDVFKLFKQADDGSSGSGVGLALVTTILAKLGGRIWHEANSPYGTNFTFCVPLNSRVVKIAS